MPPHRGSKTDSNVLDPEDPTVPDARHDNAPNAANEPYTVVARRYRPQKFDEVVGQEHVVRSLRNAIRLNRIAQAYLFCGTRGVGKTTMARIFAKCLNCVKGPTDEPCQVCDICRSIAAGQDVDVIEIDGASNNGVEQVRELRQNAGLRPSRSRFKVYYIDEVHMLSTGAFNALLKTLEEPPPHVKFLFATTEANKIPDTVLSRCQRFDLSGITPQLIAKTLGEICENEKVPADPDALHVIARRAAGSLRDAESLLDRLLASGSPRLTVEVVQELLGTASDERLLDILEALADRDAATALRLLDQAADQGVQPADLLGGLLDFLRDAMVLALGADSILLTVTPRQMPRLQKVVEKFPVDAIMAALQIVDQHRTRLRGSLHGRLLVEMAMVRVARLEDLEDLSTLVDRLNALEKKKEPGAEPAGNRLTPPRPARPSPAPTPTRDAATPASGRVETTKPSRPDADARKESDGPPSASPQPSREPSTLDLESVRRVWAELAAKRRTQWRLQLVEPNEVIPPNVVVIVPKPDYNEDQVGPVDVFKPMAEALQVEFGQPVELRLQPSSPSSAVAPMSGERERDPAPTPAPPPGRTETLNADPLVQKVVELFDARAVQVDYEEPDDRGGAPA